jgi:polyphenol oxidase
MHFEGTWVYVILPKNYNNPRLFMIDIIKPEWNAPEHIHAFSTTRAGGYSEPPFESFNLAQHVGDESENVETNRALLRECLDLPAEPVWLEQTHGNQIISADVHYTTTPAADGAFAKIPGKICVILTGDCLPILLTNRSGSLVAALHCGWRGLYNGIIAECMKLFNRQHDEVLSWLGPAISSLHYEVGDELRDRFLILDEANHNAFRASRPHYWSMDLYEVARQQLRKQGVNEISGGEYCTYSDEEQFYSFRRDQGQTGRMATGIWMAKQI